jgi:hypothetical protein
MIGMLIVLVCLAVFFNKCTTQAKGSEVCKL